jgi:hypothetical protein
MDLAQFRASTGSDAPPDGLDPPLTGLWWMAKGDWKKAHDAVDNEAGAVAAWVHAHLHRVEGDQDNARYWYGRAAKPVSNDPIDAEWTQIAMALIGSRL